MVNLTLRETGATPKGSPLSNAEIDQNFINLKNAVEAVPTEHASLSGRLAEDQHPIAAISGLQTALNGKADVGHSHTLDAVVTAQGLADPQADRILFWDDSVNAHKYLEPGATLDITGTQLEVKAATTSQAGTMSASDKIKLDGIAANANNYAHPANHPASIITQDANNRFVTDAEKASWNDKQDTLVSGTNIKTINNASLLGSGNVSTSTLVINNKTSAYTVVAEDNGTIINCTSGTFTVSLTAAATLGAGFNCWVWNTTTSSWMVITIDPNAGETIDGKATITLQRGEGLQIVCDGTNWQTGDKKAMRGYAENLSSGATRAVASGDLSIAIGTACTAAGVHSYAIGRAASATSLYSGAIGTNSGTQGSQAVTGAGAMALGGSYASGVDSFAAAIANNTSSYGATGADSVAMGYQAKASNASSFSFGGACLSSGARSVALGSYCTSAGLTSLALGYYATSESDTSVALGTYSSGNSIGKFAYSTGRFTAAGDSQTGKIVLRKITTNATPVTLTVSGGSNASEQVILPNDSTYAFTILVVARRTDADNESAGYKFEGVVDRNDSAATTAIVGTVAKTVLAEDTAAWDCDVTADTTNGGLAITFTGEANKTILVVATCWTSEVTG